MKKSLAGLILCGLLLPIVIAVVAPLFRVTTMFASISAAKNRVEDFGRDFALATIESLRSRILHEGKKADPIRDASTQARYRVVSFPTFTGSFGIDYLSYSVPSAGFEHEIKRWQQAIANRPVSRGEISAPQDGRSDPPPWWPNQKENIMYLGSVGFVPRMADAPTPHSVWIDRESSVFYVGYSWGH